MAKNLGKNVSQTYDNIDYAYDSVVFQEGKPPLDSEMNLTQQLLSNLIQKANADNSSGWISKYPISAKPGNVSKFYTQDISNPLPELALVNGWVIDVTSTQTSQDNVNVVDMSTFGLASGSRVDGVFLEVWRGLISDETTGTTTPSDLTQIGVLKSVAVIDTNTAWIVGENGIILKTTNGGDTWLTQPTPASGDIYAIKFASSTVGYMAGAKGAVFKTDNSGETWTTLTTPGTDNLNAIHIINSTTVIIVGDNGTILKSSNGYEFSLITSEVSHDLNSVYFYDNTVGWAVGANGTYLRSIDSGVSWSVLPMRIPDPSDSLKEIDVVSTLNKVSFTNLSDGWVVGDDGLILRTTDGGSRWADISGNIDIAADGSETASYTSFDNDYKDIAVVESFPIKIDIAIKELTLYSSASYVLSPEYLDLAYVVVSTQETKDVRLTLSDYFTDDDLADAINAITDADESTLVFTAIKNFDNTLGVAHSSSGSTSGSSSMSIRFSMGTQAWIVGTDGMILTTQNGGARWVQETSTTTTFDLHCASFSSAELGWVVGDQGDIAKYLGATKTWESQDTDLVKQIQRKVYYEGNNESPASKNLRNDSVHPDIRRETTARTQVQYRIRVVDGVDINSHRDAGLGSDYIFSQGPSASVLAAGGYPFTNMGEETGDYGLWRATCRNTVDGFSYAIPMFLVTRRNSSAYNASTNINGTSIDSLGAIRPDGLTFEDIIETDVLDIRRKTGPIDLLAVKSDAVEKLLKGELRTSVKKDTSKGGQVGSLLTYVDTTDNLPALINGEINSAAVGGITTYAGSDSVSGNSQITEDEATSGVIYFDKLDTGLYEYEVSSGFAATIVDADSDTTREFLGTFGGLGTSQAYFTISSEESVEVAQAFTISGEYINYGSVGLTKTPSIPLQVKSVQSTDGTKSEHYYGIPTDIDSEVVRELSDGITDYQNYVEVSSTSFGGDTEKCGSAFRLHVYQNVENSTITLQVAKNIEGYFVLGVKKIVNLQDGGRYRIASLTTSASDSNINITLASTYTIAANSVLEIVLEVTSSETDAIATQIGQMTVDKGETVDAYRSPFLSVFNRASKGVSNLYKAQLVEVSLSSGLRVDLTSYDVLGVATSDYVEALDRPTVWQEDEVSGIYTAIPGTYDSDEQVITLDNTVSGNVLVPVYVSVSALAAGTDSAIMAYKSEAPQTLQPLLDTMDVEFISDPSNMLVSSLGDGGGFASDMYDNVLNSIPVFADTPNTAFFFNIYGLELQSFDESQGFLTLPYRVSRKPSGTITLSGSSQDGQGRTFYRTMSENLIFKSEAMSVGNPRKLMVPFLVRVKSKITSPALHGEVLLAVITSYENTTLANDVVIGPTEGRAVVALYKVPGMPLVK